MRILFLSGCFPYPADNGSKIRIYNLLKGLSQYHEVTLLSFSRDDGYQKYIPELNNLCYKVQVVPWKEYRPTSPRSMIGVLSQTPRSIVDTYSIEMKRYITAELRDRPEYNLVIASEVTMAAYHKLFYNFPSMFEDVELGLIYDRYINNKRPLAKLRLSFSWFKLKRYMTNLLNGFDTCTVVSYKEKGLLSSLISRPKMINVIPNCVDLDSYQTILNQPEPNTLIFSGSLRYQANYEAVRYFIEEVLPLIRRSIPDVRLKITGQTNNIQLPSMLFNDNIQLLGYVDDVKEILIF